MIPRAIITTVGSDAPLAPDAAEVTRELEIVWFDRHPGDIIENKIQSLINNHFDTTLSKIIFFKGHVIYLRWWRSHHFGLCVIMASIEDDFYKIGLETYTWSQYVSSYHDAEPNDRDDLLNLFREDHHDYEIKEIPQKIRREWFDLAIDGGTITIARSSADYHLEIANIFGFFPWIIYFGTEGSVDTDTFQFSVVINAGFNLDEDGVFRHIEGELDEEFWLLVYQFVVQLDEIPPKHRGDTWYRYLQAVHDFTSTTEDYEAKINNMFNFKDLIPNFDFTYLRDYVKSLLETVADQPSSVELCFLLLDFSSLLLDFDFTELAKLTEATTLEHALQLQEKGSKEQIILQLTERSSTWGDQHLISFIQTLTGLLSESDPQILSKAIDMVSHQLKQSWDGILSIVESKLSSQRISEAIALRFEATKQIADKFTRSEDIYTSLMWAQKYEIEPNQLYELSLPYLDYALDTLSSEILIEQTDVLTQTCIRERNFTFIRFYLQYIRSHLDQIEQSSHQTLLNHLEQILTARRDYPLVYVEFLLLKLFTLLYQETRGNSDYPFEIVGQIFNSVDPSSSHFSSSLRYISSEIIEFGTSTQNWAIVVEARRRFLLLSPDEKNANNHLKTVFFKSALTRSKLPSSKVSQDDIGIALFHAAIEHADLSEDYSMTMKIFPTIKKLAIKSRSYSELADLILTEIRLRKLRDLEWIPRFLDDLDILANRGHFADISSLFNEIFSTMDLTSQERRDLLKAQLQLAEVEPDILEAEEIYNKRLELAELGDTDESDPAFLIDNYQQGISELISKGDTSNLTNLLLDAISYAKEHEVPELKEFKELFLDNFDNVVEDYKLTQSPEIYQYLLTVWRKLNAKFESTDLTIIIKSALKLFELNRLIYSNSHHNQYLRRTQLIMKELSLVISNSSLEVDGLVKEELFDAYDELTNLLIDRNDDFGITTAILESAVFGNNLGEPSYFLPFLDEGIAKFKGEILNDQSAQSGIFLLLILIVKAGTAVGAESSASLFGEITNRIKRVLSFALSVDLSREVRQQLVNIQRLLRRSPETFLQEFPLSIDQYLENLALS